MQVIWKMGAAVRQHSGQSKAAKRVLLFEFKVKERAAATAAALLE